MTYLCCPICQLRLPGDASLDAACPICDGALERTNASAALGYQLLEIGDPLPLSPIAAAAAVALSALRPHADQALRW
jgi:hypothetical protein